MLKFYKAFKGSVEGSFNIFFLSLLLSFSLVRFLAEAHDLLSLVIYTMLIQHESSYFRLVIIPYQFRLYHQLTCGSIDVNFNLQFLHHQSIVSKRRTKFDPKMEQGTFQNAFYSRFDDILTVPNAYNYMTSPAFCKFQRNF